VVLAQSRFQSFQPQLAAYSIAGIPGQLTLVDGEAACNLAEDLTEGLRQVFGVFASAWQSEQLKISVS
jgi:hypothetical protein